MIYLDNAATSYPKPAIVYENILKCMKDYCANPGRGGHSMSITCAEKVMRARAVVSSFFSIDNELRVCFTKNATEALNTGIKGFVKPGSHVITTAMEHNSVLRPLRRLEKERDVELTIVGGNSFGEIDPEDIRRSITPKTALIVCTMSSNVNGTIMPFNDIAGIALEKEVAFFMDAAQGAGSIEISASKTGIDMIAFPGHKGLLGPQGTGGLYVREGINIDSLMEGGTGSNSEDTLQPGFMPDILESGTLNTPGIIGMMFGIDFINKMGIGNLKHYKYVLTKRLYEGIRDINEIQLYSLNGEDKNSGIVAFNIKDMTSTEVSSILDKKYEIASRAGLHCAPLAHRTLGTLMTGVVRLSVGCFNTLDEIDQTVEAVGEIAVQSKRYLRH